MVIGALIDSTPTCPADEGVGAHWYIVAVAVAHCVDTRSVVIVAVAVVVAWLVTVVVMYCTYRIAIISSSVIHVLARGGLTKTVVGTTTVDAAGLGESVAVIHPAVVIAVM